MTIDSEFSEDLAALEAYVLDQLAGGVKPDRVIFTVAQRQQWHWSRAEAFVNSIATQQSQTILNRQKPLLRAMSVMSLVAGFFLVYVTLSTMIMSVNHLMSQRMADSEFMMQFIFVVIEALARQLPLLMVGVSLVLAGVIGWIKTLPPRISPALDYGIDADDV